MRSKQARRQGISSRFGLVAPSRHPCGGRSSAVLGPVIVSPPRLVIAPSRSSCRIVGVKGVSFPSVPCRHRARASPHRSPWLKRFNHSSPRARSHHGKQAGKGGPSPFRPSYRRAGSHRPTPIVAPSSARRASKQDGGGSHSVRPPRPRPVRLIGSSTHSPRSIVSGSGAAIGQSVKSKTPRSPCRGTGRKAFIRSIARGNCNRKRPSYRRRYRWQVPAPSGSSRRR